MIELYLSKVTENSESEQAGKLYARVSYKQAMDIHDMAHHMAEHNTAFSEGLIVGVLTDFVKCTREMVLSGNTVKVGNLAIFKATVEANVGVLTDFVKCTREMVLSGNTVKVGNLAIFKATVEANALDTLYDAEQDKVASATIGTLAEGQKTGPAVRVVKLLAQSTGDFTREELKKDVKLAWSDKTKAEIAAAKGGSSTGSDSQGGSSTGSETAGGGSDNTGGDPQNPGDGDDGLDQD